MLTTHTPKSPRQCRSLLGRCCQTSCSQERKLVLHEMLAGPALVTPAEATAECHELGPSRCSQLLGEPEANASRSVHVSASLTPSIKAMNNVQQSDPVLKGVLLAQNAGVASISQKSRSQNYHVNNATSSYYDYHYDCDDYFSYLFLS